ncbi:ARMT1-like domain-containing protein [Desulfovibrio inopinatus]|uniref:ARMT1-like domain-containing protein n=1 Tax=Desulfovibrio inopinatus TaxID=102109 RepID=UPI000417B6EB|nr:ARMT1-like domain-containing protein [Desulfovibrio inopinatus]
MSTPFSSINSVKDVRYGIDPVFDAWLLHFMSENNIEYSIDPLKNASPEQLRFMVDLPPDAVYVPCTDTTLFSLLDLSNHRNLLDQYQQRWQRIRQLFDLCGGQGNDRLRMETLCRHKYDMAMHSHIYLPSRLTKRLLTIFLTQSGQADPYQDRKREKNRRAQKFLNDTTLDTLLAACPSPLSSCGAISELRFELDMIELRRSLSLSTWKRVFDTNQPLPGRTEIEAEFNKYCPGLEELRRLLSPHNPGRMKILFLPEESGGHIFDLLIVRCLLRQGHRVIMALKEGFYFDAPTYWDRESDSTLAAAYEGAFFFDDAKASKNRLLDVIKENPFVVISDGTRERLNLIRTSVTFARAWKEADLILAKGVLNTRRIMQTSHSFTRDIICFSRDANDTLIIDYKPKPQHLRKFTEIQIRSKAESLITRMRAEKAAGRNIMFYSAIVGSIPHETETAINILNTFVPYLRSRMDDVFIINPAEHFEEGMDADDLMYMWEKVQRSGLITIWRFQTYADIEKSFELLGRRVPTVWAGKDATFSTGCTKEMGIALDMQKRYPELQIIGPSSEQFFRRREYGVGKFCDVGVDCD